MSVKDFFKDFFKGDTVIWICFLTLIAVSIVEMYSASSRLAFRTENFNGPITRHVMFLMMGLVFAYLIHRLLHYKYIPLLGLFGYFISIILLILVLFFGESANGANRWFNIFGIRFQPSELAKLTTTVVFALFLGRNQEKGKIDKIWVYLLIIPLVPGVLIMMENLSTALLLLGACFIMLICAGLSWKGVWNVISSRFFIGTVVVGILFFAFSEYKVSDVFHRLSTWQARIVNFYTPISLDETFEITDQNRQSSHAKIAISNGRYFGLGVGDSEQRDFLAEAYSDFIFAIIVEEIGLFSILVVFIYLIIFSRAFYLIYRCDEPILCYTLLGLSLMLLVQAYFHVGVALGCFPVTGQPLPIISRGGTSIVITSLSFGLMLCISRYINESASASSSNGRQTVDKSKANTKEIVKEN